jgi:hypothetical protein
MPHTLFSSWLFTRGVVLLLMGYLLRFCTTVSPWVAGTALFLTSGTLAAQQSRATSTVEIQTSIPRVASLVSACRDEAEKQAVSARHPLRWDAAARPQVTRERSGARAIADVSIAGWARYGDDWVPIIARCAFDKGRPVVSLALVPAPLPKVHLDLSGIAPLPDSPGEPQPTLPAISLSSPPTDPPATSGSSLAPTLGKTPSEVPPAINKDQDFLHHHWFGVELHTPF